MKIYVANSYITKFGELWDQSLTDLFSEAVDGVLNEIVGFDDKKSINPAEVEAVFVANMASGMFEGQLHLGALVSQMLPHNPPAMRVEGACASGSLAVLAAEYALLSGQYKTVMVVGAEKMTDVPVSDTTDILSGAANISQEYGSTFPALYALLAKAYMRDFGVSEQELRKILTAISVENHKNAIDNPKAQFIKSITHEIVDKSQVVSEPLRLFDCSPISDGAAALILSTDEKYSKKPKIIGFGHAQDSLDLASRDSLSELVATKKASKIAYEMAGIEAKNIAVAEVHDCFTIAELLAVENLGFCEVGGGIDFLKNVFGGSSDSAVISQNAKNSKASEVTNKIVINPSGGLKACGHPVGATGVKQIAFISSLLSNKEQNKYENCRYGLTHNVGGSGATAVVHILEK